VELQKMNAHIFEHRSKFMWVVGQLIWRKNLSARANKAAGVTPLGDVVSVNGVETN
jgi:hypothetical protein